MWQPCVTRGRTDWSSSRAGSIPVPYDRQRRGLFLVFSYSENSTIGLYNVPSAAQETITEGPNLHAFPLPSPTHAFTSLSSINPPSHEPVTLLSLLPVTFGCPRPFGYPRYFRVSAVFLTSLPRPPSPRMHVDNILAQHPGPLENKSAV